jgi:hypothetical protein
MPAKNLDTGDGALRHDTTRRFMWTLTRLLKTGVVTKQGWGPVARWGSPLTDRSSLGDGLPELPVVSPTGNALYY